MAQDLEFGRLIKRIGDEGARPVIVILGNGLLGEAFAAKAIKDNAGHVLWYARDYSRLNGQLRDILHSTAALGIQEKPSTIIEGVTLAKRARGMATPGNLPKYKSTPIEVSKEKTLYAIALGDLELLKTALPIADIVYYTLGLSEHRSGERERATLLQTNACIVADHADILKEARDALHIVVSNPDNVIAKVYAELAELDPRKVVTAGNTLDTIRFRSEIASFLATTPQDIGLAAVFGNHGPGMEFLWDSIQINGKGFDEVVKEALLQTQGGQEEPLTLDKIDEFISNTKREIEEKVLFAGRDIVNATGRGTAFGPEAAAELIARAVVKKLDALMKGKTVEVRIVCGLEIPEGTYGVTNRPFLGHSGFVTSTPEIGFHVAFDDFALRSMHHEGMRRVGEELTTKYNSVIDLARQRMRDKEIESRLSTPSPENGGGAAVPGI